MNETQTFICYLYVCAVGILLLFSRLLHIILLFWIFQLEVSLLCRPKLIWLEFSNKLQLSRWLENSNMISFGLTSLVTSCPHILYFFLLLFLSLLKPLTMFGENYLFFLFIIDQAGYVS